MGCDQRRLARSVGASPTGGKSQKSPWLGWQAGGRPIDLKPIDRATFGVVSKSPGHNESERTGSLEREPGGGADLIAAKAAGTALLWLRRDPPAGC